MTPESVGLKAGRISKPYGVRGSILLVLIPSSGKYLKKNIPLFIDQDGQRIPFFVEEFELIAPDQAILKFEFIQRVEEARKFSGCEVFFDGDPSGSAGSGPEDFTRLVGYAAIDIHIGALGRIEDYLVHEVNPVFVIRGERKEILIPAVPDLLDRVDHNTGFVYFDLPDGLTSL